MHRQTTCDRNTALCIKVHRAIKIYKMFISSVIYDTAVMEPARCLKVCGVHEKPDFRRRPFMSAVRPSLGESIGPPLHQKKIEFEICGDAISLS